MVRGWCYRRHHRERMVARAYAVYRQVWRVSHDWATNYAQYAADNMARCSCYACRNPRRADFSGSDKLTIQERRVFQDSGED